MRNKLFVFLCLSLIVVLPLAGIRSLRIWPLYPIVGAVEVSILALAAWRMSSRTPAAERTAGLLLIAPFLLFSFLWVGIGTPWDSPHSENVMRYFVLFASAVTVAVGFMIGRQSLFDQDEKLFSNLASATAMLSGAAYVVWTNVQIGIHSIGAAGNAISESVRTTNQIFDALLFGAGMLAYATNALFAVALFRSKRCGLPVTIVFLALSLVSIILLGVRGVSFPDPTATDVPWYVAPGFIVGIPAIPWVVSFYFGLILLKGSEAEGDEL